LLGTLILISHDRTFLNNVVGSTVVMEGDGIIEQYAGGYDDYLLQKQDTLNKTGKTKIKTKQNPINQY
jgi:ATP-binding cassette subfamily F protein uup